MDILRFHCVIVYTVIVEYSIIIDSKAPIMRCFPFINKVQRDSISVTKYSNCFFRQITIQMTFEKFHTFNHSWTQKSDRRIDSSRHSRQTRLTLLFRKRFFQKNWKCYRYYHTILGKWSVKKAIWKTVASTENQSEEVIEKVMRSKGKAKRLISKIQRRENAVAMVSSKNFRVTSVPTPPR